MRVRPFGLTWPAADARGHQVEEAYVRGSELVVDYALNPRDGVRSQIVWSVRCESARFTLGVTIAMQTPFLTSNPNVQCETEFQGDVDRVDLPADSSPQEDKSVIPTEFLFRLPWNGLSYVEMICPEDLESPGAAWQGNRLRYRVMRESLEKGVIRKARMRCVVVPQIGDVGAVRMALDEFRTESPPLTT